MRACVLLVVLSSVACGMPGTTSAPPTGSGQTEPTTTGGNATAGNSNAANNNTGGSNTSSQNSNSFMSSVNFEDGSLHDWGLVDFQGQPTTRDGSGIVSTNCAHGSKCLMAVAGPNFTDAVFLANSQLFPATPNQAYVRFYINITTALPQEHTTFAVATGTGGGASGTTQTEVRMGGQFNYLVGNLELNDAQVRSGGNDGDPANKPNAVVLNPNTWTCMEILFDGQNQAMHTWVNNNEVTDLAVTQPSNWSTPPSTNDWMPTIDAIKLGWQAYGGTANTVYLDDVALSHTRIGCL